MEENINNEEDYEKKKSWGKLVVGIIVGIIVVGIILVISNDSNNNIPNHPNQPNCRDVQVPYEEQEEYMKTEYYTETIPYEEDIPLNYRDSILISKRNCGSLTNYVACWDINIYNVDTIGGIFRIKCNFRTLDSTFDNRNSKYIKPGETEILTCEADINLGEDIELVNYIVTPPTKTETRYKEVQRERQVTAYRPVTKYRTETICD